MATRIRNHGHPPGTTVLDKDGDVLLELGSENLTAHLLVSSKVLSLASSVFRAMFTHGFSEGEGLSSISPRVVPLPEDNPPAMTLLCQVLHFCTSVIPMERDVAALAELAILCDKYDCAAAVKLWSLLWSAEWLPCAGNEGFEKLLFVAYGLDLPEAFSKVTKALVENHPGPLKFDTNCPGYDMLPEGLTSEIESKRNDLHRTLLRAFEDTMTPFIAASFSVPCIRQVVGVFYYHLSTIGLWPLSEKLEKISLSEIQQKVSQLTAPATNCANYSYCQCTQPGTVVNDIKRILQEKIAEAVNSTTGLCLDCVKAGRESGENEKCRLSHEEPNLKTVFVSFQKT